MNVPIVIVRRYIAASAAELFDAWLDPAALALWMRPGSTVRSTAKVDAREGGTFEIVMHTAERSFEHRGVYRRIEPPRCLAFTWHSPATHDRETLVTVEFRSSGHGTEIELRHEQLPDAEAVRSHTEGWSDALALLGTRTTSMPRDESCA